MIATLARQDYEAMLADGLPATLDDFDRLNSLALRLERGAETTDANYPRIGWAGDVPFHQPTCAAIAWYYERVERGAFDVATKNACWFYALAHGRTRGAFAGMDAPDAITDAVNAWLATVHATVDEMARACRYATQGFDDAEAERTDAEKAREDAMTEDEKREERVSAVSDEVTATAALTGIPPAELETETPSRLARMVRAVRRLHKDDEGDGRKRLRDDYMRTHRAIVRRLNEEKRKAAENGQ